MKKLVWTLFVAGTLAATETAAHIALFENHNILVEDSIRVEMKCPPTLAEVDAAYPQGVPENFYEELGDCAPDQGEL